MRFANRIAKLPPYLFAEVDRRIAAKRKEGVDVISLGIGDPDLPTPQHIIDALAAAAAKPYTHQYPEYEGLAGLSRGGGGVVRTAVWREARS